MASTDGGSHGHGKPDPTTMRDLGGWTGWMWSRMNWLTSGGDALTR